MRRITLCRLALRAAVCGVLTACQSDQATQAKPAAPVALHLSFGIKSFGISLGYYMILPQIKVVSTSGDTAAAPRSLVVVSRDSNVVRIDSGSIVRSIGMGSTWIVASVDTAGQSLRDSLNVSVLCTMELIPVYTPPAQTLAVGESFTPSLRATGCGGHLSYTDIYRWRASDSTIIRVDSLSGVTTGLRPGLALLLATGARFGPLGYMSVTVKAP
jgi:hypothetical protein